MQGRNYIICRHTRSKISTFFWAHLTTQRHQDMIAGQIHCALENGREVIPVTIEELVKEILGHPKMGNMFPAEALFKKKENDE